MQQCSTTPNPIVNHRQAFRKKGEPADGNCLFATHEILLLLPVHVWLFIIPAPRKSNFNYSPLQPFICIPMATPHQTIHRCIQHISHALLQWSLIYRRILIVLNSASQTIKHYFCLRFRHLFWQKEGKETSRLCIDRYNTLSPLFLYF